MLDRGEALVSALLTLSRSEAVGARTSTDLAAIARDVITATPEAGRLELRLALATAPVQGDPTLLERLAGNLIENAVRYNVSGGLLSISTATSNGSSTMIVANDGTVLRASEVPTLLERFHRHEQRTGTGFGLGLPIADAIARGHGGTLALRPRLQGGLEAGNTASGKDSG